MQIVDTHCHASPSWYEPIETLRYHMDRNEVDHAVLIQHNDMYDNEYLLECVNREPERFTAVVQIDPDDPTPRETLTELAESGATGIRLPLGTPVAESDYSGLWETADELGLVVSVQGTPRDFASETFEEILRACSTTPVVLEHLAGLGSVDPPYDDVDDAFATTLSHADHSNVYVKVPGLGEFCPRPPKLTRQLRFDTVPPHLERVTEAFGAQHMMWGSDFPPCSSREGYRNTLEGVRDHTSFNEEQLEWILGKTAVSVWDIPAAD